MLYPQTSCSVGLLGIRGVRELNTHYSPVAVHQLDLCIPLLLDVASGPGPIRQLHDVVLGLEGLVESDEGTLVCLDVGRGTAVHK